MCESEVARKRRLTFTPQPNPIFAASLAKNRARQRCRLQWADRSAALWLHFSGLTSSICGVESLRGPELVCISPCEREASTEATASQHCGNVDENA